MKQLTLKIPENVISLTDLLNGFVVGSLPQFLEKQDPEIDHYDLKASIDGKTILFHADVTYRPHQTNYYRAKDGSISSVRKNLEPRRKLIELSADKENDRYILRKVEKP